jgi:hypothetical protein
MRRRKRRPLDHLKAAKYLTTLEQNAWQRGLTDIPGWTRRKPVLAQIGATVAGCGFGLTLGSTWWQRGLFGALVAAAVFLMGLGVLWLWHSTTAPVRQRNEARVYARALEAHVHAYTQWVQRRMVAEQFRWDTSQGGLAIADGTDTRSATELERNWRAMSAGVRAQLVQHGAAEDVDAVSAIDTQLRVLDTKEDQHGDDEIGRIRDSMVITGDNVLRVTRNEQPPTPPMPPEFPL